MTVTFGEVSTYGRCLLAEVLVYLHVHIVLEVTIAFRVFANIVQFGFEIKIEMLC